MMTFELDADDGVRLTSGHSNIPGTRYCIMPGRIELR